MTCPKCHGEMRVYERSGVTIDQCTECRGIFLDRGELEKLFDAEATFNRQAQAAAPPRPAQAPGAPGAYAPPPPPPHGGGYASPPPPAYGQPGYGQPGYGQPGYGQPAYPPAAHGGYHGHYRQRGYHGHTRHRKSFLNQLFD